MISKQLKLGLIFVLLVLIIVILCMLRNNETFKNPEHLGDRRNIAGLFSLVKIDSEQHGKDAYDLDKFGPSCLSTCVREHVQNIDWANKFGSRDLFYWNKQNPNKGFCFTVNDKEMPFKCSSNECINKCGVNNNKESEYDPEKDFSQCVINENLGCIEKNLNIATGNSIQNTVGCKDCSLKYKKNLDSILNVLNENISIIENKKEQCKTSENS